MSVLQVRITSFEDCDVVLVKEWKPYTAIKLFLQPTNRDPF